MFLNSRIKQEKTFFYKYFQCNTVREYNNHKPGSQKRFSMSLVSFSEKKDELIKLKLTYMYEHLIPKSFETKENFLLR